MFFASTTGHRLICVVVNYDDEYESDVDEETSSYVNKEVEEAEKHGDREPLGRPNSFLNRMISHGNKKTEDQLARDAEEAAAKQRAKQAAISQGQTMGAAQTTVTQQRQY